jgi:hypothetical protein
MEKVVIIFFVVVLFSCSASKNNNKSVTPALAKRYNSIVVPVLKNNGESVIDIFTTVLPPNSVGKDNSKTIFDLTSEGQKAYIKAISEKSRDDVDKFTALMNKKYLADDDGDANTENLLIRKIHLVFSVTEKEDYSKIPLVLSLGDRIEYLKIYLKLDPTSNLKFTNWDKFNTQYGEFNIGSRSFTNTKDININPSIPFTGGAGGSLSFGSLDNKKEFVESDSLKRRFILLNGILQEDNFTIEQVGNSNIDLTGNSSIDLTLNLKSDNTGKDIDQRFVVKNLKSKTAFSDPKDVKISRVLIYYPQLSNDLSATITCNYALRHIIKGADTYGENDDDIQYYYGSFTKQIILIKKQEVRPGKFGLETNRQHLFLKNVITNSPEEISFASFQEAEDFKIWILYTKSKIPTSGKLVIDGYEVITKNTMTNVLTNINGSSNISDLKIDNIN